MGTRAIVLTRTIIVYLMENALKKVRAQSPMDKQHVWTSTISMTTQVFTRAIVLNRTIIVYLMEIALKKVRAQTPMDNVYVKRCVLLIHQIGDTSVNGVIAVVVRSVQLMNSFAIEA